MSSEPVRLYVGGLPSSVSCSHVGQRFESFGTVISTELVPEKRGTVSASSPLQPCRGFAYVQFIPKDEASLRRCVSMVRLSLVAHSPFNYFWAIGAVMQMLKLLNKVCMHS